MTNEDERKQRLSILCKKLRGGESLRSFAKKRSQELGGIGFTTWGAWERGQADLSKESLERLVKFIGCSYQAFNGYLEGFISLEELLQPCSGDLQSREELDFSPDTTSAWIKSLQAEEQLFIVTQGFQAFQEKFDALVEKRSKEKIELLLHLLSGSTYPENFRIEETAIKLDLSVEDLRKLCDRHFS